MEKFKEVPILEVIERIVFDLLSYYESNIEICWLNILWICTSNIYKCLYFNWNFFLGISISKGFFIIQFHNLVEYQKVFKEGPSYREDKVLFLLLYSLNLTHPIHHSPKYLFGYTSKIC